LKMFWAKIFYSLYGTNWDEEERRRG